MRGLDNWLARGPVEAMEAEEAYLDWCERTTRLSVGAGHPRGVGGGTMTALYDGVRFVGHDLNEGCEHYTVGPYRAWCLTCAEWWYPDLRCARWERAAKEEDDDERPFPNR